MNINNESNNDVGLGSNKDPIGKVTGFFLFRNLISSYSSDKNSGDDERKKIKKYGVASFILSLIAVIISISCLLSTIIGNDFIGFSYALILIIYILGGVVVSLILAIYGFIFAVMQIRLNRKAIGIIGLSLSILSVIASLLLVVFIII
ncbi:MAG: hypothetical protein IJW32_00380 [Clostridia bacterium]|nr:hypothetical protein [Clostridia bacterium]